MITKKTKGHLAMMGANIAWGLMAPLSKSIMMFGAIGYLSLVSFRLAGAAIAFWVASLFVKKEKVPPRDLLLMFVAALFAIVFNQGIYITGVSLTSPINASIVTTFLPIITMVISAFYLKEPITFKKFLGVIVGGAGAVLIIVSSTQQDATSTASNSNLKGILLVFLAQMSYAIYFVFFKKFVEKYSPITLMKWMFLFAIVFNQGIYITGVSMTSPINASIVTTFLPIITMIISAFYLKEPITFKKFLGVIVGGAGAVLIIVSSTQQDATSTASNSNLKGILSVFLAQMSYAIYFVFFKKFVEKYSPITLMKWMFLFATITYLPFGQSEFMHIDYTVIPFSVYRDIIFVVLGSTFFTYLMVPIGQKNLRPTVASMYNNLQPIVATIAAAIMGIDAFGPLKGMAIALVFLGVYIVNSSKARQA